MKVISCFTSTCHSTMLMLIIHPSLKLYFLSKGISREVYKMNCPCTYHPCLSCFRCEEKELVPGPSVPAAQAVQQNVSSSILMPGITTCHESPITAAYFPSPQQPSLFPQQPPWLCPYQPISPHSHYPQRPLGRRLTPSLGSPFLRRVQFQWGIDFYIRIDHAGYYHTYPHVGGIYQTLQEAERGIECYLHGRRDPKM
jgi:hypothetical protein